MVACSFQLFVRLLFYLFIEFKAVIYYIIYLLLVVEVVCSFKLFIRLLFYLFFILAIYLVMALGRGGLPVARAGNVVADVFSAEQRLTTSSSGKRK